MKQLKVTWQDGNWNRDGDQPIATALVPCSAEIRNIGEDTLAFRTGDGTVLMIPGQRLISAVEVEEVSADA